YQYLGFGEPFLHRLVPILANQFKGVFDELWSQKDFVERVIYEEEVSFLKTLDKGIRLFLFRKMSMNDAKEKIMQALHYNPVDKEAFIDSALGALEIQFDSTGQRVYKQEKIEILNDALLKCKSDNDAFEKATEFATTIDGDFAFELSDT